MAVKTIGCENGGIVLRIGKQSAARHCTRSNSKSHSHCNSYIFMSHQQEPVRSYSTPASETRFGYREVRFNCYV